MQAQAEEPLSPTSPTSTSPKDKKEKRKSRSSASGAVAAVGKFLRKRKPSPPADNAEDAGTAAPNGEPVSSTDSRLPRPASAPCLTSASGLAGHPNGFANFPATVKEPLPPAKLAAVLKWEAGGKVDGKGLSASNPVEDFLSQGVLPVSEGLLQVSPHEPIGSVVEKMYQWRLRSCIVAYSDGKKDFFDCMDLAAAILDCVVGSDGASVEFEDWATTKMKLRTVAETPVGSTVQHPRGSSEFRKFEAEGSLGELLSMFSELKRVPVYRRGDLCRVVTPSDILEMCCCVSSDTEECLDATQLSEMMRVRPGMFCDLEVSEGFSVIEVLQAMRDNEVNVTPVVEGLGPGMSRNASECSIGRRLSQSSVGSVDSSVARTLVGQFDADALRVMMVHLDPDEGSWWWEDRSLQRNILLDPCMDYLALSGTVIVSDSICAPFNIIKDEDSISRCIARVLASTHRSVIVYPSTCPEGNTQPSARGEPKFLHGSVSTLGLVESMVQGGLFDILRFDPSKPSRMDTPHPQGCEKGRERLVRRRMSKQNMAQGAQSADGPKGSLCKVKFCPTIEVDCLDVPTCPDHGINFLKFMQNGEGKYTLDFHAVRDLSDSSRVAGAAVQCMACLRPLGRVRMRPVSSPVAMLSPGSPTGFFDVSFDLPFMSSGSKSSTNGATPTRTSNGSPVVSALKRGTSFPLKKSKTAERLDAIRAAQQEAQTGQSQTGTGRSEHGSFFRSCCSPCHSAEKDQIQSCTTSEVVSREDSGNAAHFALNGRASGTGSPKNELASVERPGSPNNGVPRLMAPGTRVAGKGAGVGRSLSEPASVGSGLGKR